MSDNNMNNTENRNNYNKEVQDRYKAKCMQIAIRYGLNEDDLRISQAIEKYCRDNGCSRGSFTRDAIVEKLKRDGYLTSDGMIEFVPVQSREK